MKTSKHKFEYSGKLEEYQLTPPKRITEYEIDSYSPYQNYLYKRALYGLSSLSKDELETICSKKKIRIQKVHQKSQNVLNIYKQRLTNAITNMLFEKFFPESPITSYLLNNAEPDDKFRNVLSFKDLNISKDDIVKLFIEEGILPRNFMELKNNPNQLPRLKGR